MAITKRCSTFLAKRRPDLFDTRLDCFVNDCLNHLPTVEHEYDPTISKEVTWVYQVCLNRCRRMLSNIQRDEMKYTHGVGLNHSVKNHEDDDKETELLDNQVANYGIDPKLLPSVKTNVKNMIYSILRKNDIYTPLARLYIGFVLETNGRAVAMQLYRDKVKDNPEYGNMKIGMFKYRIGQIKTAIRNDPKFGGIIRERRDYQYEVQESGTIF